MRRWSVAAAALAACLGVTAAAASVPDLPSRAPRKAPAKAPARHAPPPAKPKTATSSSATRAQVAELIARGNRLFDSRDWAGAIEAYNQAIALDPTNAAAHYSAGWANYWGVVDWAKAEAEIRTALSYDPKNEAYQKSLADVVRRRAEEQRILDARQLQAQQTQQQLAAKKAQAQQWVQRGDQLRASGAYQQAVDAYEQAWHVDQANAAAFMGEGIAYYQLKKYAMAQWGFETALKYDPNNQQARSNLEITKQRIAAANTRFQQTYQRTMQERAQQQQRDRNAEVFNNVAQGLALGYQAGVANRPAPRPTPAPQTAYPSAPRQYATTSPPPRTPTQGAPAPSMTAGPPPAGCIGLEKNPGGSFWSVVNRCPAAVIGHVCFDNDRTFNCGTQTPAGFGPIRPGGRESIYGPSLQATAWHASACYYDDWLKGCRF